MPNPSENRLLSLLSAQEWHLDRLYSRYSFIFGHILKGNSTGILSPDKTRQFERAMLDFNRDMESTLQQQITNSFGISNSNNDALVNKYVKGMDLKGGQLNKFLKTNDGAVASFLSRKAAGLNLSDRVWGLTNQAKESMESVMQSGILSGRSASETATDLKKYLKEPNRNFRRVRNSDGKLMLSNPAKNYHPGKGIFRSSYKNALRLSRNEINIAYRTNDFNRRQDMTFVTGQTVKLSGSHPSYDICDELTGTYPKNFLFTGWHPNCYDKETEVYTDKGWLSFSDVTKGHKILSLKEDKNTEWANVEFTIKKPFNGKMVHFYNRSLDMLVTPEHPMVYVPKSNTKVIYSNKNAAEFDMVKGGLYRSSEYQNESISEIEIGDEQFTFDLFCEFMGYYLSDGSKTRKYAIIISQREDNDTENYYKIQSLLIAMGLKFKSFDGGFRIHNKNLWHYLTQFGKCNEKYIPEEIKNSSAKQIAVFLDAYVSCDGYIKTNKSFIGSRGTICEPKNKTRSFFTTSKTMADEIGELILKIGKRPSFKVNKPKTTKFKNGTYTGNYDVWVITECHSQTSTVFKKDYVEYNDFVYDVQLDRNHILLTRRNGKVVWGSNCICFSESLLLPRDKFKEYLGGGKIDQRHQIRTVPKTATDYLNANSETIKGYKNKPYFIQDNFKNTKEGFAIKSGI